MTNPANKGRDSTPDNPGDSKIMLWIRDVALKHQGNECLIWPFWRMATGYGRLGRRRKMFFSHRYICEWVNGPPPAPHFHAAHSCERGHEGCVSPHHLSWATPTENRRTRRRSGPKLGMAKANQIRAMKGRMREDAIAARFGVSERTVRRIHYGQIWNSHMRKDGRFITRAGD